MDNIWNKMPKHNSQSAANLPSYYKKEVSSSLGRNIDSLAKQFNKEGKEEFKNDQQIDNGRYFIFVVWGSFRVGQHITFIPILQLPNVELSLT